MARLNDMARWGLHHAKIHRKATKPTRATRDARYRTNEDNPQSPTTIRGVMTVSKEEVLIWLTQLGRDWVGLHEAYEAFGGPANSLMFWESLQAWHDSACITKRHNQYVWEKYHKKNFLKNTDPSVEQYRLTKRALELLTST